MDIQTIISLIKALSKPHFDELVKSAITAYYKVEVVRVDGPGDGGIDIRIYQNKRHRKIPVQVTIQKLNYKRKLKEDLGKISVLIDEYSYESRLVFFHSQRPETKTIEDLEKFAREKHQIELEYFDAQRVAELIADKNNYPSIGKTFYSFYSDAFKNEPEITNYESLKFDLLSYGKKTTEIKNNLLQSYILFLLQKQQNPINENDIFEEVQSYFGNIVDRPFFERQKNQLSTNKKILLSGPDNIFMEITASEASKIIDIKKTLEIQKHTLFEEVQTTLDKYSCKCDIEEVIKILSNLYEANYKYNLNEIIENVSDSLFENNLIKDFEKLLQSNNRDEDVSVIVKELLSLGTKNNYLQKIAAGKLFSQISRTPQLTEYINRSPKQVYLDTSILLYITCNFMVTNDHDYGYDLSYYTAARYLLKYFKEGRIKLEMHTSSEYVRELAFQVRSAFMLSYLTESSLYDMLGHGSSNIFYNFFSFLKKSHSTEFKNLSFREFLDRLGNFSYSPYDDNFLNNAEKVLTHLFEVNDIQVKSLPLKDKVFEEVKELFERYHSSYHNSRAPITIKNDSLMISFLFRNRSSPTDYTFLTWDNSFQPIRKQYHEKNPNAKFWHLSRPANFLDQLSVINLEIKPSTLTIDILSALDNDFNIKNEVSGLADSLSRIINLEKKSGYELVEELAKINHDIYRPNESAEEEKYRRESPLDEIFNKLEEYYNRKTGNYGFKHFTETLNSQNVRTDLITFFEEQAQSLNENRRVKDDLFKKMDKIIKKQQALKN